MHTESLCRRPNIKQSRDQLSRISYHLKQHPVYSSILYIHFIEVPVSTNESIS